MNFFQQRLQNDPQMQQMQAQPWYQEYLQAYNQFMPSGAYDDFKNAINQIATKYPGAAPQIGDVAGKAISGQQMVRSGPSSPFGISEFPKETGHVAAELGKAGMMATGAIAGGVGLGAMGAMGAEAGAGMGLSEYGVDATLSAVPG